MTNIFISPHLAQQIEALGASIRCLDGIEHKDLVPIKLEIAERMLATSAELKTVLPGNDMSQIRPYTLAYAELECFLNADMGPLQALHHRIHIRDEDDYCLKVAEFACSDRVREGLQNALNIMRNPEPTNIISAIIGKLMER